MCMSYIRRVTVTPNYVTFINYKLKYFTGHAVANCPYCNGQNDLGTRIHRKKEINKCHSCGKEFVVQYRIKDAQ